MGGRLLKILLAHRGLPNLPAATPHIVEFAQDKAASKGTVADAVKMDPSLAAKVLRIANSPLYAQRRRSNKLTEAVMPPGLIDALSQYSGLLASAQAQPDLYAGMDAAQQRNDALTRLFNRGQPGWRLVAA